MRARTPIRQRSSDGKGVGVFGHGGEGRIYTGFHDPNLGWSSYSAVSGGGLAGGPGSVYDGKNVWVFARGTDGKVYGAFHDPSLGWQWGFSAVPGWL